MSIILNIDTSVETASVSIARDGAVLSSKMNAVQKDHASFLHISIKELFTDLSMDIKQVDAVAVTSGPGSYTGLRVGMASAKGLAYALKKPFITLGTLNVFAMAAINSMKDNLSKAALFCPMIDARRKEVYTALFDQEMREILPASAMVLNERSFQEYLQQNSIFFFGNGAAKWKNMVNSENAGFINELNIIPVIALFSNQKFMQENFTPLNSGEPLYVKEFYNP